MNGGVGGGGGGGGGGGEENVLKGARQAQIVIGEAGYKECDGLSIIYM